METYEVIYNENTDKGVYALSVVESPAMEGEFIFLNKQEEIKLAEVDKEQRILMGVALIPDKLIYRNQGGKEFNIMFSAPTIKDIAHGFLKNGNQGNSTIEHETKLSGVSVVESWIIEDENHDKSRAFGFDYPKGSWMATMKVDNDELWNDYVKTGKIKGFSIDGLFSLEKINLNTNMSEEKKESRNILTELADAFKAILGTDKKEGIKEEVKLGSVALDNEAIIEFDGETLEIGKSVYIRNEEGENIPLPDGDYKTADGFEFSVLDGVVVERVVEEVKEEVVEELSSELDVKQVLKDLVAQFKSDIDSKIENLKVEFKTQLDEKNKEIEELKKEPATKPIKHTAELSSDEKPKTSKARILQTIQKNK